MKTEKHGGRSHMKTQLKKHFVKTLRKRSVVLGYCILFLFLAANVALSQIISPLYFQLSQPNQQLIVEFLKAAKPLPLFKEKLILYKNMYGSEVEEEVFADDKQREALINQLEQILLGNPSQKDILYSLYLLYSDKGDLNTAAAYFKLAKEVDPTLK